MSDEKLTAIADKLRDLNNLIAVFKEEYDLPEDVTSQLKAKIEEIVNDIES